MSWLEAILGDTTPNECFLGDPVGPRASHLHNCRFAVVDWAPKGRQEPTLLVDVLVLGVNAGSKH